ncbi:hypothetical protein PV08_08293 [Exophiala spinifera]|uniref:Uncharacterized protein n=1 Tax=Exophiala spinifera TaxID=91928 RepID=A0A0D1YDM1_9EURO|nr:uncharacterized protein PV08_08293 [Exophiala spinifera]KIW13106.1 hypothetical protein PV08_08293 [Exophiala spinifera]
MDITGNDIQSLRSTFVLEATGAPFRRLESEKLAEEDVYLNDLAEIFDAIELSSQPDLTFSLPPRPLSELDTIITPPRSPIAAQRSRIQLEQVFVLLNLIMSTVLGAIVVSPRSSKHVAITPQRRMESCSSSDTDTLTSVSNSHQTCSPPSSPHLPNCPQTYNISPHTVIPFKRTPLPVDHLLLIGPSRSALVAFQENGHRMGIGCACVGLVKSWRHPADLPAHLQPTPLQLTTPHSIWIDRMPFPRMRDNIILLAHMIDLEDFYLDLLTTESFEFRKGMPPHDPAAYRIDPSFRAKWGYLFH